MNRLNTAKRIQAVAALVKRNSLAPMTGVVNHTADKFIDDMGYACAAYYQRNVRNSKLRSPQCNEIWAFLDAKGKNALLNRNLAKGEVHGLGRPSTHIPSHFMHHNLADCTSVCAVYQINNLRKLSNANGLTVLSERKMLILDPQW